jgi:hypothetical protein
MRPTKLKEAVERIGQCHCGPLRVIATGESDRVYLCYCKARQRRTGTAFHFGASCPKERVRLDGEPNATPTAAIAFDFTSARIVAPRCIGKGASRGFAWLSSVR